MGAASGAADGYTQVWVQTSGQVGHQRTDSTGISEQEAARGKETCADVCVWCSTRKARVDSPLPKQLQYAALTTCAWRLTEGHSGASLAQSSAVDLRELRGR